MKKTHLMVLATLAMLPLAACNDGQKCCKSPAPDEDMVYTGILPAADADGIRYTVSLDYDDDNPSKGDYKLVESYLLQDSTLKVGARDSVSYKSEGDFKVEDAKGGSSNKYLRLVPDRKYSDATPLNFLVTSDSTLVLVGPDDTLPEPSGLNYTLRLVK